MTSSERVRCAVDLSDPDLYQQVDPHEVWTQMRRETPVAWTERVARPGFWSVTRYADIVAVSTDRSNFTSTFGTSLGADRQLEGDSPVGNAADEGRMLLTTDPPEHTRLRKLVNKWFTPRTVQPMEAQVRAIARDIVTRVADRGGCDFVVDIAAPFPLAVICELLGIPSADWDFIIDLGNRSIGADDPEYQTGSSAETSRVAGAESYVYFSSLVEDRRRRPGPDLLSELASAEVDGERLTEADLVAFCLLLAVAGNETTRNTLSGGLLALEQHPDQRRWLLDEPSVPDSAVDELLRWVSPIKHFYRVATSDIELGGQRVRAGERVVMWYPSGNRDERVFDSPFRLDLTRAPNEHLAFGTGPHFCLGAYLARLEIAVLFEELFARCTDVALAGPAPRVRSCFMGGHKHLPIRFTPA